MKVLLLSRYGRLGASSRVRMYQYIPYLESQGVQVTVAPFFDDEYLENLYNSRRRSFVSIARAYARRLGQILDSSRYDILWIEKEIFPWLPAWFEKMLCKGSVRYVVDYDDAVFHRYDMHGSPMVRTVLGHKIDVVMRCASVVTVGNEYLAERAKKAGARRVVHLPSAVDLNKYRVAPVKRNGVFTIGWIGSPATAKYLKLIQPALKEVCKDGRANVLLVGSGPVELDDVPTTIVEWSEETEVSWIQQFDVGIMPLVDGPWERGKCGYKLIQCMACGKPVVASPVGANREIVREGINGFLAGTTTQWIQALLELGRNIRLANTMGCSGRRTVEQYYHCDRVAPMILSVLDSMLT
ncbi:glycosyltransferase family 4 protein [Kyrpidia tusciae]|uniref:Glycosyl transferase group 1 n=1 Tax=Kyrpidia tusciae (strain DSM 2912 / NBRC 15312 / T2) TaxID=562970 RepID=D5WVY5_KYRT2|nr:glycosyltransferase family 4 protein [Kyrpidia tusciae]ADG05617.1 glycosyl transferase group 1 [Kyrpidia tusciae DSM 2912]